MDELEREWTLPRIIGWALLVWGLGLDVVWLFMPDRILLPWLGTPMWWCGCGFLFWSWVAWRRRKWVYDNERIRAMARQGTPSR